MELSLCCCWSLRCLPPGLPAGGDTGMARPIHHRPGMTGRVIFPAMIVIFPITIIGTPGCPSPFSVESWGLSPYPRWNRLIRHQGRHNGFVVIPTTITTNTDTTSIPVTLIGPAATETPTGRAFDSWRDTFFVIFCKDDRSCNILKRERIVLITKKCSQVLPVVSE